MESWVQLTDWFSPCLLFSLSDHRPPRSRWSHTASPWRSHGIQLAMAFHQNSTLQKLWLVSGNTRHALRERPFLRKGILEKRHWQKHPTTPPKEDQGVHSPQETEMFLRTRWDSCWPADSESPNPSKHPRWYDARGVITKILTTTRLYSKHLTYKGSAKPHKSYTSFWQVRKLRDRVLATYRRLLDSEVIVSEFEPELGCESSHSDVIICVHNQCLPSRYIYYLLSLSK